MFNIKEELKKLPDRPGVYIMKDIEDKIIYIGKAVVLKNRVRQYFQNSKNHTPKVRRMVSNIDHFEYIVTDSELEALILECNLIKKHKPKYNILLKDDKHYPYIKVTMQEEFPRVLITRKIEKDGAKYFGPYVSSWAVNETIETIKRLFPIKTCNKVFPRDVGKSRPCLNYYIKRCLGPCQGGVNASEYREAMKQVVAFLNGQHDDILKQLEQKMIEASEKMEFEMAVVYRDRIAAIKTVLQKQKIISSALVDEDIIAFAADRENTCVQIFFIRGGKLIGREYFILNEEEGNSKEEVLSSFIKQFYSQTQYVPGEIVIQNNIDEAAVIENWLSTRRGSKVTIKVPQRGEKKELVEMVSKNALVTLNNMSEGLTEKERTAREAHDQFLKFIGLDEKISRLEAYDISNTAGHDSVGSMVTFIDGVSSKKYYRRFKIKSVVGANDYESMKEVLGRRFKHGLEEQKQIEEGALNSDKAKFSELPHLIMMDGGEIQIKAAKEVLSENGIYIPVVGMVKDNSHKTRGILYEGKEYKIPINSPAFRLVFAIQEEVHRFAIEYHRNLRNKGMTKSVLDKIEGIGQSRRNNLLKELGSVEGVRRADIETLKNVKGMNEKIAEKVYNYFKEFE